LENSATITAGESIFLLIKSLFLYYYHNLRHNYRIMMMMLCVGRPTFTHFSSNPI